MTSHRQISRRTLLKQAAIAGVGAMALPQIVASSLLGFILKNYLHSEPMNALVLGGASMGLAALLTLLVVTYRKTGTAALPAGGGSGH